MNLGRPTEATQGKLRGRVGKRRVTLYDPLDFLIFFRILFLNALDKIDRLTKENNYTEIQLSKYFFGFFFFYL